MILTNLTNMKIGFVLILTFSMGAHSSSAQQGVVWEAAISVADGSIYGNIRPRLSLASGDTPVVVFGNTIGGAIYSARFNGTSFDTPVNLLPSGEESYLANWTGPDIAAYGNTVVVVYKAQPYVTADVYTVRSIDGGMTFSDTIRADNHDIGETWMPAIDMDDAGNPVVTYMTLDAGGGNERIAVVKSLDGGLTYQPQVNATASSPGVACDCCAPEVLATSNYQMVLYRNNDSNLRDGFASLSEDNGATYTSLSNMDNLAWNITSCPATGPHGVILGDSVYYVSASRASGKYRAYVSAAGLSGGLNFNSVLMMDPPTDGPGDTQNFPRISGVNDTLVMVWEERVAGNTDVKIAVATDGSIETLVAYKSLLNPDPTGTQAKPDVIYRGGYVHAVFQDFNTGDVMYRRGMIADVTGLMEDELSNLTISPNPANDLIVVSGITANEIEKIKMINLLGETVECDYQPSNGVVSIDLSKIESSGVYILQIFSISGASFEERIVIQ